MLFSSNSFSDYVEIAAEFFVNIFVKLYNFITSIPEVYYLFFAPFAVYIVVLLIDFFRDVSEIHYDKKVSFYDFKTHYRTVKNKKKEFKKLYDNPNLTVSEKSQKLQTELIKKVRQKQYLDKQSYIRDIETQLHGVPDDLKHSVAEKIYNSRVSHMAKYYGSGVLVHNHGVEDSDDFDETDEI